MLVAVRLSAGVGAASPTADRRSSPHPLSVPILPLAINISFLLIILFVDRVVLFMVLLVGIFFDCLMALFNYSISRVINHSISFISNHSIVLNFFPDVADRIICTI